MQLGRPIKGAQQHINAYIQYCNLVGDNGGVMMSQAEFQNYKQNYHKIAQNRTYATWYNQQGLACKTIGPSSKCFCDHAYKYHDFISGSQKVKCKQAGCKCQNFTYVPIYGSQDLKCICKHSYMNHDPNKKICTNCPCKSFKSNWSCSCGLKYDQHKTVSQGEKEKQAKGEVVDRKYGGLVSFGSILDGAEQFGEGVKQEIKQRGIKVSIQEFKVGKMELMEEVSAWELMKRPINWGS